MDDRLYHPIPIPSDFIGRDDVRAQLTQWTQTSGGVLVLFALGGMGKSTLARLWVDRDVKGAPPPEGGLYTPQFVEPEYRPKATFWWSFYEQNAGFRQFLTAAWEWLSGLKLNHNAAPSELLADVCRHLEGDNFLIILDGFERELREYAQPFGVLSAPAAGECVDPLADEFLRVLRTAQRRSSVLITSRQVPSQLSASGSRVRLLSLSGFSDGDVLKFLRKHGIEGDDSRLLHVSARFGHHPLALRLLVGRLEAEGVKNIAEAEKWSPISHLRSKTSHILQQAFLHLSENERAALRFLSASPDNLEKTIAFQASGHLDHFRDALSGLERRGIIRIANDWIEVHPVVRSYASEKFPSEKDDHISLGTSAWLRADRMQVPEDRRMRALLRAVYHLSRGGDGEEALAILGQCYDYIYFFANDYAELLEAVDGFFDSKDEVGVPQLSEIIYQTYVMTVKAQCFERMGELAISDYWLERTLELDKKGGDISNIAMTMLNLARGKIALGRLREADEMLDGLPAGALSVGDYVARKLMYRGRLYGMIGRSEGTQLSDRAINFFRKRHVEQRSQESTQALAVAFAYGAETYHDLEDFEFALKLAQYASALAAQIPSWRERARSAFVRLLCRSSIDENVAELLLEADEVLKLARSARQPEFEVRAMLIKGALYARVERWSDCWRIALEAARTAGRMGLGLHLSEAHLLLAKCAEARGRSEDYLFHIDKAKELSDNSDDYTYVVVAKQIDRRDGLSNGMKLT
ncbi:hypothetical protein [Azospirillum argentinense]|uniref:hypothetical protein n=1 Tax=Azospirillum argentinense TaxID=2970906 RepID=UPI0032DF455C